MQVNFKILLNFLIFLSLILITSCLTEKEELFQIDINCDSLQIGVIKLDKFLVGSEISKLTIDLYPKPTSEDYYGHAKNFDLLIERINTCQNLSAESYGYCGIETYPPQSEILIETLFNRQTYRGIVDILTSKDTTLIYLGIHGE